MRDKIKSYFMKEKERAEENKCYSVLSERLDNISWSKFDLSDTFLLLVIIYLLNCVLGGGL